MKGINQNRRRFLELAGATALVGGAGTAVSGTAAHRRRPGARSNLRPERRFTTSFSRTRDPTPSVVAVSSSFARSTAGKSSCRRDRPSNRTRCAERRSRTTGITSGSPAAAALSVRTTWSKNSSPITPPRTARRAHGGRRHHRPVGLRNRPPRQRLRRGPERDEDRHWRHGLGNGTERTGVPKPKPNRSWSTHRRRHLDSERTH